MKKWLMVLFAAAAAFMLTGAAPSPSEAHVSIGVGGSVFIGPGWYGPYYSPYYSPYYGPYYDPWYYRSRYYYQNYGYLQTVIGPEDAEVWVDGKYFGYARDFDGTEGYLRLTPGEHEASFRMPGYKTYVVSLTVGPGGTTVVDYNLVPLGTAPPGGQER